MRSGLLLLMAAFIACAGPGASTAKSTVNSPNLTPFVGAWARHGESLTVTPDGSFDFEWRTYRTCGQDPPPCDQMVNNIITGGGRAIGKMHAVGTRVASGQVTDTNDPAVVPPGSFEADDSDYELLTLKFPSRSLDLCGKDFPARAPARVARSQPCGA